VSTQFLAGRLVKRLLGYHADSHEKRSRDFRRETQTAASLDNPDILL